MYRSLLAGIGIAAVCTTASAQSLFSIRLTETGNAGNTEVISSNSVLDLVDSAINTDTAQTQRFQTLNTTFGLDYAGVPNAITMTKNAANTQATLTYNIGNTSITRTFNGVNQADLERQIEDYLRGDGAGDLTAFYQAINATSLVGVSDGNPNATTARMADFAYTRFGFHDDMTASVRKDEAGRRIAGGFQWRFGGGGGAFSAGDFDGETAQIWSTWDYNFNERIGISGGVLAAWTSVEGADIFHSVAQFGVPIRIIIPSEKVPLLWQVTPHISSGGSGSEEFATGGWIVGAGATSLLTLSLGEHFAISMCNQVTGYEGQTLEFENIEIDPGVSQRIAKNGLKLSFSFAQQWYIYGGATYSNFLDDAAVEEWVSPAVGIGWWKPGGSGVQIGYFGDIGDDFESHQGRVEFNIAF